MTDRERRFTRNLPIEFRAAPDGSDSLGVLAGFAIVYDKSSVDLGGFTERVAPGAANKTVRDGRDIIVKFNHDPNMMLGRTASGTARVELRDEGVWYEVDLPDTTVGRDVAALAARGDIVSSSFEFRVVGENGDTWEQRDDGSIVRTLNEIALYDVAPVVNPAYPDATAGLKRFAEARGLDADVVLEAAAEGRIPDLLVTRDEDPSPEAPAASHAAEAAAAARARRLELIKRDPAAG